MNEYSYTSILKKFYLRRAGSEVGVSREHAFKQGVFEHELRLIPNDKYILDAGAGDGRFSNLLAERNEVVCLEAEHELLQLGQDRGLKYVSADLNAPLPFSDDTFDIVFSRCVIEHLYNPWMFFSEAHRILKHGGELLVSTTNAAFITDRLKLMFLGTMSVDHDLKKWTPLTLSDEMQYSGFEVKWCNHTKWDMVEKIIPSYMFRSIIYQGVKS